MKILLVYTNRNRMFSPPPISFAYLSYALKKSGHQVKSLDFMFTKSPYNDLEHALRNYNPDIVGISIRNLDNQQMFSPNNPLPVIKGYVEYIKKRYPEIKIVVGGAAYSIFPMEMYKYLEPNYGISGQGEASFPKLIRSIEIGSLDEDIPGLVWNHNGVIRMNPNITSGYKSTGADWSILDLKKYRHSRWPAVVTIKTGCIYKCSFCRGDHFESKMIFRSVESIIDDIKQIKKLFGLKVFFFADPCFGSPLDKTKVLLSGIIRSGLKIQFIVPSFIPMKGCYDDELFKLFKKAGGLFPIMSCDSLSEKMLTNYNKSFTLDDILNWSLTAKRNKVRFLMSLLFGGPGEDEQTVRESMAFIGKIPYSLLLYTIGIRILPGTKLSTIAQEENILCDEKELLFPKFYISKELNIEWAKKFIESKSAKYKHRALGLLPAMFKNAIVRYFNFVL